MTVLSHLAAEHPRASLYDGKAGFSFPARCRGFQHGLTGPLGGYLQSSLKMLPHAILMWHAVMLQFDGSLRSCSAMALSE